MNNILIHSGILGQKWGIRNGPPYPLDYKSHSSKEKKLNPKSKIDGASSTKNGLTDKQKNIIKGVAIGAGITAATLVAAYGAYKISSFDKETIEFGQAFVEEKVHEFPEDWKRIDPVTDFKELANNVNPSDDDLNCMFCAFAVDMKRKGIDAQANYRGHRGTIEDTEFWYKNTTISKIGEKLEKSGKEVSWDNIYSSIKENGDSYGMLFSEMIDGNSHCVFYECRNSNITIVDGQKNYTFSEKQFAKIAVPNKVATYVRTDNLEIDTENMDMIDAAIKVQKK